jgi:hypothetical protein
MSRGTLRWSVVDKEHLDITNISRYSGKTHTIRMKVRPDQFTLWSSGAMAQEAFPDLTPDEREFIISGITKEEWDELFGE